MVPPRLACPAGPTEGRQDQAPDRGAVAPRRGAPRARDAGARRCTWQDCAIAEWLRDEPHVLLPRSAWQPRVCHAGFHWAPHALHRPGETTRLTDLLFRKIYCHSVNEFLTWREQPHLCSFETLRVRLFSVQLRL